MNALLAIAAGSVALAWFYLRFFTGAYTCPGCGTKNGEHDKECHFS